MYVDSSSCARVQGGESELFRIYSGVREGCIMSPWLFNLYMDEVMKEVKMGMGRRGLRLLGDRRKWRLPDLLYADDLFLCSESEEDLREMVGWFAEVCRRRKPKINASKSKVMVLNQREGLKCEVNVDRIPLEHVSEFKYLGCA